MKQVSETNNVHTNKRQNDLMGYCVNVRNPPIEWFY